MIENTISLRTASLVKHSRNINSSIKRLQIWLKTKQLQLKPANLFYISDKCINTFCLETRETVQKLSISDAWRLHGDGVSLARHVHQYLCRCMEPAVLELRLPEIRCESNNRRREVLATNSCCMTKDYDKCALDWKILTSNSYRSYLRPKIDSLFTFLLSTWGKRKCDQNTSLQNLR